VVVEKQAEIKMVDVLVPLQKVDAGTPLEPAMFRREARPQVGVTSRVIKDFEEIKGTYARSLIVPGQPLYRDFITNVRPTNALTANIPEGYRAVTIRVDARSGVEGWARAGARVDVVWATRVRGQPGVNVIVQNARVLSAERDLDAATKPGQQVPSTVTLLVSAADANKIQLATTTGSISLSLRGDNDPGKGGNTNPITVDDLLGSSGQPAAQAAPCEGTVRMRGKDGKLEEFCMQGGKMVPAQEAK
jgi:pilus assembly protein CpaB